MKFFKKTLTKKKMASESTTTTMTSSKKPSTSRFEIERVADEPDLNSSFKAIDESFNDKQKSPVSKTTSDTEQSNQPISSNLKKPSKHFMYDDDFFDLDSAEKAHTAHQSQISYEKEPLTGTPRVDSEEGRRRHVRIYSRDSDSMNGGCLQINYDEERNEPRSLTCNLSSSGVKSYQNCCTDFKTILFYQKLIAEFIGTMLLTLYACSIGLPVSEEHVPSINGCLGAGLTLATLIWILGHVSGGHFNPAVTIGFFLSCKINPIMSLLYIGAQLSGAIAGSYLLFGLSDESVRGNFNLTCTQIYSETTLGQAFGVETIITFILMFTIFSCVDSRRKDLHGSFPLQIGFAVAIGGMFGGRFTGGSMNPARSFGPAVITGIWTDHWVYWIGPITGSLIAALVYQFALTVRCPRRPYRRLPITMP